MNRRLRLAWSVGLIVAVGFSTLAEGAENDRWVGREFTPTTSCRPKIGTRDIPLNELPLPFKVQKVQGDWLWVGQAWVKKQDVVAVEEPVEVFDVAKNGDFLLVPVFIDGRAYQFVVDTGCTSTVVDNALESKLLNTGRTTRIKGKQEEFTEYRLPDAFVGKSRLPVPGKAVCVDMEPFRKCSGHDIRGLLGMSFLKDKVVQIDFDAGKLAILRTCHAQDENSFPLTYTKTNMPILNCEIVRNQSMPFGLDTGSVTGDCGHFERPIFKELIATDQLIDTGETSEHITIYGEETIRCGKLKRFSLGRLEHTDLAFTQGRENTLGLGYLSRFAVTFDFPNDRVHLQKGRGFEKVRPEGMFGATIFRVGRDTFVANTNPKSPAGRAGLRKGDRILLIDGKESTDVSLFELDELFSHEGQRLRLVVQGDAEPREVDVLLADWRKRRTGPDGADQSTSPNGANVADDVWIGRNFWPKRKCKPMIGEQPIPRESLSIPYIPDKAGEDWISIGDARILKSEVVSLQQALPYYTAYLRDHPKSSWAYHMRARIWEDRGDTDYAIEDCTDAIRLDPKSALDYAFRGNLWCDKDELDKALADCSEAIRLDPQLAWSYGVRCRVWQKKGEFGNALKDFIKAIRK